MGRRRFSFRSRLTHLSPVAVSLLPLTVAACSPSTPPTPTPTADKPNASDAGFLNQWRTGRDARELARTWYLTPQGSSLLDFDVFMSIPSASDPAVLFSDRANLESYGFLYSDNYEEGGTRRENSRGLPVGVVKDTRGEGHTPLAKHAQDLTRDYVGLTCAACHTGDLKYNGERFLIHAGQSNLDYERFISDLSVAVSKAVQDPKGTGYLARMSAKGADEKTATSRLAAAQQRIDGLRDRGQVPAGREAGPGRIDAVGHILNEVFGHQYGDPNDAARPYDPNGSDPRQHQAHSGSGQRASGVERGAAAVRADELPDVELPHPQRGRSARRVRRLGDLPGPVGTVARPLDRQGQESLRTRRGARLDRESQVVVEVPSAQGKPGRRRQGLRDPLPTLSRTTVSRQVQCAVGRRRRELERQERPERSGRPLRGGGLPWPDPIRVEGHQGRL